MSLSKVDSFWEWFDKTRGDTPVLEVERLSGSPRGRISNSYRKKQPSALVCQAIARGLSLPEEIVFRAAGLLASMPPEDATLRELLDYARSLTQEQRQAVLRFAKFTKNEDAPHLPVNYADDPERAALRLVRELHTVMSMLSWERSEKVIREAQSVLAGLDLVEQRRAAEEAKREVVPSADPGSGTEDTE